MADKKFYWLKLKKDFFKRHDIRIIEEMPNGKDYVLFYLKLLLESIDHDGSLRFSDTVPYNENMLSIVTNTNIDIVRSAMKIFIELNMMSVLDDQTIFMSEVTKLIGSAADNDNANRQRRFREQKNQAQLLERYASVTKNNESKRKSIEIEKELELEKEITPLNEAMAAFRKHRSKIRKPMTEEAEKRIRMKLDNLADNEADKIEILYQSIENGWAGVFALKKEAKQEKEERKYSDPGNDHLEDMLAKLKER